MKFKPLALAVSLGLLTAQPAVADTVFGVYAGAQGCQTDVSGRYGSQQDTMQAFNFDSEQQTSFYVALEHPIPLVPNFKVRQNDLATVGLITLGSDFVFNGEFYASGTALQSAVDLSHTDYTLYYELFDNDLISFDLGLTAKDVDALVAVTDAVGRNELRGSGYVPTAYGQLRVGIPATDWTFYALANAVSIDDSEIRDFELGAEYRLIENALVDFNLQLGYRSIVIELDDIDSISSDLDFSGPYLGLEFHF